EILGLLGCEAARDEREARALGGIEADEAGRAVQEAEPDDVPVEDELGFDVLDEDQGAPDFGDAPECLDRCHRRPPWLTRNRRANRRRRRYHRAPPADGRQSSRRITGKRSSSTARLKPAASQNAGVAALVASGSRPASG